MMHDLLSDVLSIIKNGDNSGKKEVYAPASNFAKNVLKVMQRRGYIGEFEFIDNKKGGKFRIELLGLINNCNAVRPRFDVKKDEYAKYEMRFLPAAGFGFLVISTSRGFMTNAEAKEKGIGGKILAFVY